MSELCEIVIHVTHFREKNKKNLFKSLLQANEREWSNAGVLKYKFAFILAYVIHIVWINL